MPQQYDNTNSGALFVNDKQGNDKRPDWRGSLDVNGVQYWISGWEREGRSGALISLRVEAKTAEQTQGGTRNPPARTSAPRQESARRDPAARSAASETFDDDIPF